MAINGVGGIGRFSRSLALGAGIATARFPVSALLILVISGLANAELAGIGLFAETDLVWLLSALSTALAASVAVRLASESNGMAGAALSGLPLLAAVVAGSVVWFAEPLSILAPPLVAALTLAIPLAPYAMRPDGQRFWTFTLWASVGVVLAFLSVLLFVLGVSAILEMIRYLFEIGLSSDAYGHIYTTALTLVGPLFALGRIPRDFDEEGTAFGDDRLTTGVRFLFDWVGAPLALATAAVLHLYAAKILLLGEWPKNEVGWIVTFYAVLVLSFRIAAEPFIASTGASTTRLFGRLWAPMLVVPLALLVYAAARRIGAEGFTLERYYLALGALAASVVVAAQLVPRLRGDIRFMAGVPLVLLALSSVGPWGATETVGRSQAGLIADGLDAGASLDVASLADAERAVLRSRIEALDEVDEIERILPLFADADGEEIGRRSAARGDDLSLVVFDILGLGFGIPQLPEETVTVFSATRPLPLDLAGYDTALPEQSVVPGDASVPALVDRPPPTSADVALAFLDGTDLVLRFGGVEDRFALGETLEALEKSAPATDALGAAPLVVDLDSAAGRTVRARIVWASLIGDDARPQAITAQLLLKMAEWVAPR